MRGVVFVQTLRDRRRSLIGWSLAIGLLALAYTAMYPAFQDMQIDELTRNVPEAMREMFSLDEMASPEGFLNGELFTFTAPLLTLVFAIGLGTDLTAGEEERHTMDLLLAHPISRHALVAERALALLAGLAIVQGVLLIVLLGAPPLFGMDVGADRVMPAVTGQWLLGAVFGCLGLFVGALTGRRGISRATTSVVALVSYIASALAPVVGWLESYRKFSPVFHGTGYEPMLTGWRFSSVLILTILTSVLVVASLVTFQRRDVSV